MKGVVEPQQDHIAFSIWLGLIVAAFALAIDYRLGNSSRALMLAGAGNPGANSVWVALVVPCAAYLLFRLVRPFPFSTKGAAPGNSLYWLGILIGTLASAATATYLGWVVLQPALLGYYRIAGLALPLSAVIGLLFLEASLARERKSEATSAPYADAGLLSAMLIAPALLMWFLNVSPQSGAGAAIYRLFVDPMWIWLLPALVAAVLYVLWWLTSGVRTRCRVSPAYRAFTATFWIFGITSYLLFAVTARLNMNSFRRGEPTGGVLYDLWSLAQSSPLLFFCAVVIAWLTCAGAGYFAFRRRTYS